MAFKSDAHRRWWFANRDSGGTDSESSAAEREAAYMSDPQRREDRAQYAQAMFPHLTAPEALRTLNDREG